MQFARADLMFRRPRRWRQPRVGMRETLVPMLGVIAGTGSRSASRLP
ncbi:MAG: hypothetical protein OXQ90_15810 [Gammaproteobacteria bacterium]|nr:hypothetical protein [Gammaproteobacteria bacterium]